MKQQPHMLSLSFSQQLQQRKTRKAIHTYSMYAMLSGFLLFVVCFVRVLCTVGIICVVYSVLAVCAIGLIIIGLFRPLLLQRPAHFLRRITNRIAKTVLQLLLLPLYFLLCLTSILRRSKVPTDISFARWDSVNDAPAPVYTPYEDHTYSTEKNSAFRTVNRVLLFFSENGMKLLMPVIILLLLVGAFFFILSTESVFAFLYALF